MRNFDELSYEFFKWRQNVNNLNRYYDKTLLLDLLYDKAKLFEYDVRQGQSFYRGRVFDLDDIVSTKEQYEEWVSKGGAFQGYNKKESGAPPAKYASEGRLNGKGISFLYTCSDVKTVIHELRPTRDEILSVAEFVVQKNLVFADLTEAKAAKIKIKNHRLADLLMLIAEEFSVPHYAGHNYAFTQYLAGHLMNLDFDGVIFRSSLNPDGENFVFFYPEDCEAMNSQLYRAGKITIPFINITRAEL